MYFFLDEKVPKNQENSIGLHEDYTSSANFLPPRAGRFYQQGRFEIAKNRLFNSLTCCSERGVGSQLLY
jgi:hypothetical protein